MENEEIYQKAKRKVRAKKGFFYHFAAYACILAMLYAIMYFDNNGEMLPVIIVGLAWGIGLAIHYLKVFGTENLGVFGISPNWEEEELQQEIEKMQRVRKLKERLREERDLLDDAEALELKEIEKRSLDDDFH